MARSAINTVNRQLCLKSQFFYKYVTATVCSHRAHKRFHELTRDDRNTGMSMDKRVPMDKVLTLPELKVRFMFIAS